MEEQKTVNKKATTKTTSSKQKTAKVTTSKQKTTATKATATKQKTTKSATTKAKTSSASSKKPKSISTTSAKETPKTPQTIKILGYHNLELCTYVFDNVKNPKAVVLVIHGMQEHALRYVDFANFLNKNGYVVVASDLRGHGHTISNKEEYGRGEKDIFTETLKDQHNLLDYIHQTYKLPIYVFGHSYGSMLTQNLIQQTPLVEKAVICGTADGSSIIFKAGNFLLKFMSPFKRKDKRNGIEEKISIKAYGKKFKNANWLSRDEKVFEKYNQDELCGGSFPFSFYRSMMKNMTKTNNGINKIGNKKIFLISGTCDPVGANGKQVQKIYKLYLKNNIDAKMKLYEGARHELLNEINKEEVYQDVLNFFDE